MNNSGWRRVSRIACGLLISVLAALAMEVIQAERVYLMIAFCIIGGAAIVWLADS